MHIARNNKPRRMSVMKNGKIFALTASLDFCMNYSEIQESPPIPSIAILHVLSFLDWEERLELSDVFLPVSQNTIEQIAIPCKWFYERLLEESFVVAFPSASVVELLFYVNLRNSITDTSLLESEYPRVVSTSLLLTPKDYESSLSVVKDDGQIVLVGESSPIMKSCIRTSGPRFGLPKERKSPVLTLSTDSVSLIRGEHYAKTFSFNSICEDQVKLDAMEFVNGRNLCYILTGCVDNTACGSLLTQLTDNIKTLLQLRTHQVATSQHSCKIHVSISCLSRANTQLVYTGKGLGDISSELSNALRLGGHVCLEINLFHKFSKPVPGGSHANRFILCIPSRVDRSRSGLNLDTFALRKCLKAIKLNKPFVPCKESRLTQYLGLLSDHQIRIVALLSNADEEKTKASVAGLRFAELS